MANAQLKLAEPPYGLRQDVSRRDVLRQDNQGSQDETGRWIDERLAETPSRIPSLAKWIQLGNPDVQIAAQFGVRICRVRALRRYYGFQQR